MDSVEDFSKQHHFYTQYPEEEFTFTWHIEKFSKIFNSVHMDFETKSTKWRIVLSTRSIQMWKYSENGPLRVYLKLSIKVKDGILTSKTESVFPPRISNNTIFDVQRLYQNKLVNDVLKLECTMTIFGQFFTSGTQPYTTLENSKKIALDLQGILKRQEHCDTKICIKGEVIEVHKAILCARSPVFSKMFQYSMTENENQLIELNDIDFETLRYFITFLYTGEIKELAWDSAIKLYYTADKYDVIDLRNTCAHFLEVNLTDDRACTVLMLSDLHKDDKLKSITIDFIRVYAYTIKLTQEWKEMVKTNPKLALEVFN